MRQFGPEPIEMRDDDILRELMWTALDVLDAESSIIRMNARLADLQEERIIRLLESQNNDDPEYDRESAMAALEAMKMEGKDLSQIINEVTPDLTEEDFASILRGEWTIRPLDPL